MELYRIMSFFELYELLINKRLKMTKLKLMEDLNEGFAFSLRKLLPSSFNPGFLISNPETKESYTHARESNFITCWTKEKESMAMWLLYSKDFKSIRIKTSREKLKNVIDNYFNEIIYTNHFYSEAGTIMTNLPAMINEVKYIDFEDYQKKISTLKENFDLSLKSLEDKTVENYSNLTKKLFEELEKIIPHEDILFLKNNAFSHEKEVRAGISFVKRNNMTKEEVDERFNRDETISDLTGTFIFKQIEINDFASVHYIDLKIDNFIEEICFDPRMPSYQKDIYLEILGLKNDKRVVSSNIFGNYVEQLK